MKFENLNQENLEERSDGLSFSKFEKSNNSCQFFIVIELLQRIFQNQQEPNDLRESLIYLEQDLWMACANFEYLEEYCRDKIDNAYFQIELGG
ncbi:2344_t:CDS:2 [Diversispora eburnea]|uniref:2344_t:CDS:1 n=1 Tax=Diversispora eburnea TaxID=1213867 RepID=A0A9N9FEK9_9GLOM|nr:2344_t:CDS:2 [Diversispora eburnea]